MSPLRGVAVAASLVLTATATAEDSLLDLFSNLESDAAPAPGNVGASGQAQNLKTLTLRVSGLRSDDGQVRVLAYADAAGFAGGDPSRAVGYATAPAARGSVTLYLDTYAEPPLAVFVFHDENDDEAWNRKGMRPLEGYGFSGSVDPYTPPTFDRAAVVDDGSELRVNYIETRMRR